MDPLIEGLLRAGSSKGGFEVMSIVCVLIGIALVATLAGLIVCHIERFQDVGRGIFLFGLVTLVIAMLLGMKAY